MIPSASKFTETVAGWHDGLTYPFPVRLSRQPAHQRLGQFDPEQQCGGNNAEDDAQLLSQIEETDRSGQARFGRARGQREELRRDQHSVR